MRRTGQGGEAWELVTGIGSSSCQFPFTEFLKDSIPLSDFFDSSCYENSKYGILIAAAMGHRYENSATLATSYLNFYGPAQPVAHKTIPRVLPFQCHMTSSVLTSNVKRQYLVYGGAWQRRARYHIPSIVHLADISTGFSYSHVYSAWSSAQFHFLLRRQRGYRFSIER